MKIAITAFVGLALLAHCRTASAADDGLTGAFRTIFSSDLFPFEFYPEFTPAEIRAASPKALTNIRKSCDVSRADFDKDGLKDCVIEVSLRARNNQFFVLRRLADGWKMVGEFGGTSFTFRASAGSLATLETWANYGGGALVCTTYSFRNGRYQETAKREERVRAEQVGAPPRKHPQR